MTICHLWTRHSLVHRASTAEHVQDLGWGQAGHARLFPLGLALPHEAHFDPGVGCVALATAAEKGLMTPYPNSDRVHYSIKADFQMEPYLGTLHHQGPLRTSLAPFRLGQHWLHTWAAIHQIECPMEVGVSSSWCQYCASMQYMVVDSQHAMFECSRYQGVRQQQPCLHSGSICNMQGCMGLPQLQQARLIQACYEQHLGKTPVQGQHGGAVAYACLGLVST